MKKFNRFYITLSLCLLSMMSFAQDKQSVEMADVLRRDGKIYTVVIGLLVVLTGFIFFLIQLDRKVNKLDKD